MYHRFWEYVFLHSLFYKGDHQLLHIIIHNVAFLHVHGTEVGIHVKRTYTYIVSDYCIPQLLEVDQKSQGHQILQGLATFAHPAYSL